MRGAKALAVATLAALLLLAAPAVEAQMQLQPQDSGAPIEIVARDGIEWDRENMRYVARGAAKVTQGDKTVEGDTLTAFYRQPPGGGTQIYRYAASGAVKLTTPTQKAVADSAIYDLDSGVVVLTGRSMKITTPDQEITARDSLEYWEQKQLAVARGNAVVTTADGRRIGADTLAAYFDRRAGGETGRPPASPTSTASPLPGRGGEQTLDRVEAFGNVVVTTPTEVAQGEKAVYNARTGIALLTGTVKLTRGRNQANGDFLELNLSNGLYKLGCRPGTGSSCVRGLFVPEKQGEGAPRR
jgi:lipopolysaccharide export system protein LptA